MGAWTRYAARLIGTYGQILWEQIEQRQLKNSGNAVSAVCGCMIRGFPVEQLFARTEIEERELRGAKRGLSQARMTDFL
jgi:hypothetical protein